MVDWAEGNEDLIFDALECFVSTQFKEPENLPKSVAFTKANVSVATVVTLTQTPVKCAPRVLSIEEAYKVKEDLTTWKLHNFRRCQKFLFKFALQANGQKNILK